MESPVHTLRDLFAQLGLPSDEVGIARFIDTHGPLPESTLMPDAPFWTSSQAAFLREEALGDADWAAVIDALNVALHGSH
ncbi:MAG: DUF2789 domain-containing protein [Chromatiaceae bacterium]|jgi:hypothetical protein